MITETQLTLAKATFEKIAGITPEKHHEAIYKHGLAHLERIYHPGSMQRKNIEASSWYWKWFQRHYHTKNIEMMFALGFDPFNPEVNPEPFETEALRECYQFVWNIQQHEVIVYPSKVLTK